MVGVEVELKCKGCGSTRVRRSHRADLLERALSLTGLYPYHCHACCARAFRFAKRIPSRRQSDEATVRLRHEDREERRRLQRRRITRMALLYGAALAVFALLAYYLFLTPP